MGAAFAFFLVLDPAVLEPDFHLLLGQVQVRGDLDASQSGEVHVGGELPLQLQKLCAGEGCAHPFAALQLAAVAFNRNAVKLSRIGYGIRRLVDPCSVAQIESRRCVVLPPKRGVTVLGSERRERSLQQRYSWWRRVELRRRDTQGTDAEKPRFPRVAGPRGEPVQRMRGVHRVRE